jgi:phosphatidylglycerol---prolipoprotein diacylglyceryl transferase
MTYRVIDMIVLGPLHIRTWGLLVATGVLVGALVAERVARRRGIPSLKFWNLVLFVLLGGVLGSRVFWALQPAEIGRTLSEPWRLIAFWQGGLTFIGGIIGATIAGITYLKVAHLPVWQTVDAVAVGSGLGLAIGRIGCFLTGLHPGRPTTLPWGIQYLGAVRHPIPLYESLLGLALFGLALLLWRRRVRPGTIAIVVAIGYLVPRSLLDLLRARDVAGADPRLFASFTLTQGLALLLVPLLVALLLWLVRSGAARAPFRNRVEQT